MSAQLSLFEFEPVVEPSDRLLFLLKPEVGAQDEAVRVARRSRVEHGTQGRLRPTDVLHVTLIDLGVFAGLRPDIIARASEAADTLRAGPFDVAFDHVMSFLKKSGDNPFVLCAGPNQGPLVAFQRELYLALAKVGFRSIAKTFNPHMTLLYDRRLVEPRPVETIAWTAREFLLVHSPQGQSRHDVLGRWPLRG